MNLLLWTICAVFEEYSIMVLGLLLFRLPIAGARVRLFSFAAGLSIISSLMLFGIHASHPINNLIVALLMMMIIMNVYNMRLWYALVIFICGYVSYAVIQISYINLVIMHFFDSMPQIQASIYGASFTQLGGACLTLLIGYALRRTNYGFVWFAKKVTMREAVKGFNLIVTCCVVGCIILLQLMFTLFTQDPRSGGIAEISMIIVAVVGLGITYIKNRHDIKEYYKNKMTIDYLSK